MTPTIRTVVIASAIYLSGAASGMAGAAQADATTAARIRRLEDSHQILATQVRELEQRLAALRSSLSSPTRPAPTLLPPPTPIPLSSAWSKGLDSAKVGIIEYSDFQCPYCATFARDTLPVLETRYISNGLVRFWFWHRPLLEIHPQAIYGAEAAECAGRQGQFWQMHDALFADQGHLDPASLVGKAQRLELDLSAFAGCVEGEGAVKVRQDLNAANDLRFLTTPTFVIGMIRPDGSLDARHVLVGVRDPSAFAAVIDPLLAEIAARPSNP